MGSRHDPHCGGPGGRTAEETVSRKKSVSPRRSFRESIIQLEAWLHGLGYQYTGPGNLYDVTFFEVDDLTEGQRLLRLTNDGVKSGEEQMLNSLAGESSR